MLSKNCSGCTVKGKVPRLLNEIRSAFPASWLWTPDWMAKAAPGVWPSVDGMLSLGARVMVASRQSYGSAAWPLLFNKHAPPPSPLSPTVSPVIFVLGVPYSHCMFAAVHPPLLTLLQAFVCNYSRRRIPCCTDRC